jgi:hypothetical protein
MRSVSSEAMPSSMCERPQTRPWTMTCIPAIRLVLPPYTMGFESYWISFSHILSAAAPSNLENIGRLSPCRVDANTTTCLQIFGWVRMKARRLLVAQAFSRLLKACLLTPAEETDRQKSRVSWPQGRVSVGARRSTAKPEIGRRDSSTRVRSARSVQIE